MELGDETLLVEVVDSPVLGVVDVYGCEAGVDAGWDCGGEEAVIDSVAGGRAESAGYGGHRYIGLCGVSGEVEEVDLVRGVLG